jgi:hypothetical protein
MAKQAEEYITVKQAVSLSGYNAEYIRQLLRAKRIKGKVIVRDWLIDRDSLVKHMRTTGREAQKAP